MKEKVNELQELLRVSGNEISEVKAGIAKVNSMLAMIEQGSNSASIEAIPVIVDVVRKNLKDLVGNKVNRVEESLVMSMMVSKGLVEDEQKPKRTRRPRTPKTVDDTKPTDKPVTRTRTKKAEPADKPAEPEVKTEDTTE